MLNRLLEEGFVAIARGMPEEKLADVAQALYEGGVQFFEVTYDQRREDAQALLARCLNSIRGRVGDRMVLGAGTVMTADQVKAVYDAGADFIVSPNTDKAVVEATKRLGMLSSPGAFTPTEAALAYAEGPACKAVLVPSAFSGSCTLLRLFSRNSNEFRDKLPMRRNKLPFSE